ncbi:MAG: hypothetical protein WCL21_00255 [Mariniphaga sp.]
MGRAYFLLFLVHSLLISCETTQNEEKTAAYYFQYEYVNYAWGFGHSGFTITPLGAVYSFSKSTPWVFASGDKISSADFLKNISASVKADTLIPLADIAHYQHLAAAAISAKMSEPVQRGADMGAIICKIIIPDTTDPQNICREVILTKTGDLEQHNLAPEATVIAQWLTNLHIR